MSNDEFRYKRTVEPTVEPVTLAELQEHVLGNNSADDDYLERLVKTARGLFEQETGMALIEQTWQLIMPCFPASGLIKLKRSPVRSITSIDYYDTAGDAQTVLAANYRYADHGAISRITEAYGKSWPSVEAGRPDAVTVTFISGVYTTGASPEAVDTATLPQTHFENKYLYAQQAIKILVNHLYENRGVVAPIELHQMPMSYRTLVNACRVSFF